MKSKINLKLFPKMFLMTFITILSTILLFSFIFRMIYVSYINNYTKQQFYSNVAQLEKEVNKRDLYNALNDGYITKFEAENNIRIVIINEYGQSIYPYISGFSNTSEPASIVGNVNFEQSISISNDNSSFHTSRFDIIYDNHNYTVITQYSNFINNEEFSAIFLSTLPYMIFLGLIVSALISYFFAKGTSKKINHLNSIMNEMETLEYIPLSEKIVGDEISDLENHIDNLYSRMIDEMNTIKKFEKDREVFMKGSIHELKTPLMIMTIHLNELLEHDLDEFTQDKIIELYQKTNHMNKLVSEVLKASKLESIVSDQVISPIDFINDMNELYSYMLDDKNMIIKYDFNKDTILMSNDDFSKILSNLISNAIKYGNEDSSICCEFDLKTLKIRNNYTGEFNNDMDIFSPFTHNSENEDSHGLGLYVVSMLLNKYNYEYAVDTTNNTFTFTINFNLEP